MKKIVFVFVLLLCVLSNAVYGIDKLPNQFRIYKPRAESKWWYSAGYLHDGYTFNTSNGSSTVDTIGNSNIYHAQIYRFFPNSKLLVGVLYNYMSTDTKGTSVMNSGVSNSDLNISSHIFGLDLKKIFASYFYLSLFGAYGPTYYLLSASNRTATLSGDGTASYNGDLWYVGANTGALVPFGSHWLVGGVLNFVYVESNTDPYALPQTNFPTIFQSPVSVNSASLLQDFVVKYLITQHVRPFVNFGLIEVLHQNIKNPSAAAAAAIAAIPDLLLRRFGYRVGGGLEVVSSKVTFHIGYLRNERESTYHSNFVYLRLSLFT